jgi:hypothetical protein
MTDDLKDGLRMTDDIRPEDGGRNFRTTGFRATEVRTSEPQKHRDRSLGTSELQNHRKTEIGAMDPSTWTA